MPLIVYSTKAGLRLAVQRLSEAYESNREGFGGSSEENWCWGDCHKHDVLEWLHSKLQPDLYLEIGRYQLLFHCYPQKALTPAEAGVRLMPQNHKKLSHTLALSSPF